MIESLHTVCSEKSSGTFTGRNHPEHVTELPIPNKNGVRNEPKQAAEKSVGFCRGLGTRLRPPNRGGTVPAPRANEKRVDFSSKRNGLLKKVLNYEDVVEEHAFGQLARFLNRG
jgi:hypothetical protein